MLEQGRTYSVQYKDETKINLYIYVGFERGFHLFKDSSGKVVPANEEHIIIRSVYSPEEAVGRNYGAIYTIEKGEVVNVSDKY